MGSRKVGTESLYGRVRGSECGFEVEEGDATGAMFEESTGGGYSKDSRTASNDGIAFDSEAGKGAIGCGK